MLVGLLVRFGSTKSFTVGGKMKTSPCFESEQRTTFFTNRFRLFLLTRALSVVLLGSIFLIFAACGGSSDDGGGTSSSGGTDSIPAYTILAGAVTTDANGCVVFPGGTGTISFDTAIATTTARVTVSGSLEAADGMLSVFAFGTSAVDLNGGYSTIFSMDGPVNPANENEIMLFSTAPVAFIDQSTGPFTAFAVGETFASWVSDFDPVNLSGDSWWPDTTPGATGTGDVTSTGTMGATTGGNWAFATGMNSTLCSYALSVP